MRRLSFLAPQTVSLNGFSPPESSSRPAASTSPENLELVGNGDVVYVAVGKSVENGIHLLNWSIKQFGGDREYCILHVHQPSPVIPTLLGKLPAGQANEEVLSAYRGEERKQTKKLLDCYLSICTASKVNASIVTTEAVHVQKGIVDLVNTHGIRNLVVGALPESCPKVKRSSKKASYADKNVPSFSQIWFIGRDEHLWIREAVGPSIPIPLKTTISLRSSSLKCQETGLMFNPECLRSRSLTRVLPAWTKKWLQAQSFQMGVHFLPYGSNYTSVSDPEIFQNSSAGTSAGSEMGYFSADMSPSSNVETKSEEESFFVRLLQLGMEAEASKTEALTELLKYKKLESEVMEDIRNAKMFESACAREVQLRIETEDMIKTTIQEQEQLIEERDKMTSDLLETLRNIPILDSNSRETNRQCDETLNKLQVHHASIDSLRHEKSRSRLKKTKAYSWIEEWKNRRQAGPRNYSSPIGFSDLTDLAEFSLSDLQFATYNFAESFKVGQSSYGSVYKGEISGRTVAIKKLHSHNMHGQSQFQQEVLVLSKMRHPHLVTLLGVCSEASCLVYEFSPNGSLLNRIVRKSKIPPLTWKARTRIISEISSALLFLHSSSPEKIIHGDLKLENILLDFDLRCKIGDFGICRLVSEDTLRSSSFRGYTDSQAAFPYADPEFRRMGILTTQSDIYSFGLIILQILTGRSPVGLVGEVRKVASTGGTGSILDSSGGEWPPSVARRLMELGLQCCESNSRNRPVMTPTLVRELVGLYTAEERPVPSFFICPILQEIMHDPQIAADGFTYEGEALRAWLENGRETSPMTNLELSHLHLTPNHTLRLAIQDWLCQP